MDIKKLVRITNKLKKLGWEQPEISNTNLTSEDKYMLFEKYKRNDIYSVMVDRTVLSCEAYEVVVKHTRDVVQNGSILELEYEELKEFMKIQEILRKELSDGKDT